jgi:hypothetical protein
VCYQIKNQGTESIVGTYNRLLYINGNEIMTGSTSLFPALGEGEERKIIWTRTTFNSLIGTTTVKVCIKYNGKTFCREEEWSYEDVSNILHNGKSHLKAMGVEDVPEELPNVEYPDGCPNEVGELEPCYYKWWKEMAIPANYAQDEFAILHEYGHFVDEMWYDDGTMEGECPDYHKFCNRSGKKCAMKEGWAHFFSCLARDSSKYWEGYAGSWLPDFEHPFEYCSPVSLDKSQENEKCEIIVAAIFWDLYDPDDPIETFDKINKSQIPPNELVSLIKDSMRVDSEGLETFYNNFNSTYKDTKLPEKFDKLLLDGYGIVYNKNLKSKSIEASITCPANLHAYDSEGRHVGLNESGGIDLEIPYSYYTGLDSDPERIVIFNQSENIIFEVEALDEGEFNLTLTQSTATKTTTVTYMDVPITETTEATVDVSEANPSYLMEIDDDGDGILDTTTLPDSIETTYASSIEGQITTSADDGYSSPAEHYDSTANLTMAGAFGEVDFNGWYRFQNITLPAGANITRAFVTLTAFSDIYTEVPDDTLKTVIHAEYAANPLPPSSASDHAGRTRTPHNVEWDITEWEAGEIYNSPDISDIIQGLVNVHDYSPGAAIQIFHDATDDVPSVLYQPEAASGEGYITACTYDHSPLNAARLYIEYTVTSRHGDLNHDGILTPADAAIALQLAATGAHDDAADVSRDGRVTSLDALMILQAAADAIDL